MTLEERAQKAREELFERYDQLNALWLKAEEHLTKYHIPCPVQFMYSYTPDDVRCNNEIPECECLGLQKVKGKWRICYGEYYSCNQPDADWQPITECSAEIRVRAARHLPGLEKAVVESAERFIPKVDSAIKQLAEILGQPADLANLLAERAKLNGQAE
ncbi:MAG TPA: hypothetical protein VH682_04870 [Gemmataceae bacterium]|jgi:hypothetical protein